MRQAADASLFGGELGMISVVHYNYNVLHQNSLSVVQAFERYRTHINTGMLLGMYISLKIIVLLALFSKHHVVRHTTIGIVDFLPVELITE